MDNPIIGERFLLLSKLQLGIVVLKAFHERGFYSYESFKTVMRVYYPKIKESSLQCFWEGDYMFMDIIEACNDVLDKLIVSSGLCTGKCSCCSVNKKTNSKIRIK